MPKKKTRIQAGVLETLLREDKVEVPSGGGAEKSIRCFSPHHDDKRPSMRVNLGEGVYKCHGCGMAGNVWTYLTDVRGLSTAEAADELDRRGWNEERVDHARGAAAARRARREGEPKRVPQPYTSLGHGTTAVAEHDYCLADGTLVFRMMRYASKRGGKTNRPKVMPFTPTGEGDWWVCGPLNGDMPASSRQVEKYPLYRLPDLKARLDRSPSACVWIVEGEKCVDAVLGVADGPKDGPPACTHLPGSKGNVDSVDTEPIQGLPLLLIADTDGISRKYMQRLGTLMHRKGCAVRYVLPKGETGYDVADAIAEGGWKSLKKWIQKIGITPHDDRPVAQNFQMPLSNTEHFRVLGISDTHVFFQTKATSLIQSIQKTALSNKASLITLAPLQWWLDACCGKDGLSPLATLGIADSLLRAAETEGIFDFQTNIYGRGTCEVDGKPVFNVGDGLLAEDDDGLLSRSEPFREAKDKVFVPGPHIKVLHEYSPAAAEQYMRDLTNAVMLYRWETEPMGRAFLGWIVTSLIGGLLPFRPMLWLLAPAATGKTYLLEKVLTPLLGPTLKRIGDTSEAGLAQVMGHDSLPGYIDEFEPRGGIDDQKWRSILALVRLATSGGGHRVRGSVGGAKPTMFHPRFSLLLSSINRPSLTDAETSRFFPIRLSHRQVDDWPVLEEQISTAVEQDRAMIIRSHIIRHSAMIAVQAKRIEHDHQDADISTRELQISAALTAGARFLDPDYGEALVRKSRVDSEPPDLLGPILSMLSSTIPVEGGRRLALGECIVRAVWGRKVWDIHERKWLLARTDEDRRLRSHIETYGFRMHVSESQQVGLFFAEQNEATALLMSTTRFGRVDLYNYLVSLPGVILPRDSTGKRRKRVVIAGRQQQVALITRQMMEDLGLIPAGAPANPASVPHFDEAKHEDRQTQSSFSRSAPLPEADEMQI